ncbi:hypothetical protein ACZ90_17785 [Streptomyces albus subsp. albus]|nr:hypothetical protein ACZ90_17785 [Streptomyces albus subsp. albus]
MPYEPHAPSAPAPAARTGAPAASAPAHAARHRPGPTPAAVREALAEFPEREAGGTELRRPVLAGADDEVLLRLLADGLAAGPATRVVDELVRRAGYRRPETAEAVCREVLQALLYLDTGGSADRPRKPPTPSRPPQEAPPGEWEVRIRNAVALYEGLVRPHTARGRTTELLAVALPRLWNAPGGAGREVVRRILEAPGPAGFGEPGWRALFLSAVPEAATARRPPGAGRHGPGAGRDRSRWSHRSGSRGGDSGRLELRPGQLWVSTLLGLIAVALVMIVVLAAA